MICNKRKMVGLIMSEAVLGTLQRCSQNKSKLSFLRSSALQLCVDLASKPGSWYGPWNCKKSVGGKPCRTETVKQRNHARIITHEYVSQCCPLWESRAFRGKGMWKFVSLSLKRTWEFASEGLKDTSVVLSFQLCKDYFPVMYRQSPH